MEVTVARKNFWVLNGLFISPGGLVGMSLCLARPPGSKRRGRRLLSGPVALWASAVLPAGCVPSRCRNRLVRRWSRDDAHGAGVLTKTTREQSLPSHRLWGCGLLDWTVCHAPCKPSIRPCRPVRRARKIIKQKKGRIACDLGQAPTPLRAGVSVSAWNLTRRESADTERARRGGAGLSGVSTRKQSRQKSLRLL